MRSGDEPVHARSPLRSRLALAGFGLVVAVSAAWTSLARGSLAMTVLFAAVALVAAVDAVWVLGRIRQGPRFQPGPDIPPYRPVPPLRDVRVRVPSSPSPRVRLRAYAIMMGCCLALVVVCWLAVRPHSPFPVAIVMVLATLIAPVAAIVANVGWEQASDDHGDGEQEDADRDHP